MKKKFLSLIMLVIAAFSTCMLSSCGDDNLEDPEVGEGGDVKGTWVHKYDVEDGEIRECSEPGNCLYVFNSSTMTIHCKDDFFDGAEIEYKIKDNAFWIFGIKVKYTVSGNTLVFEVDGTKSYYKKK